MTVATDVLGHGVNLPCETLLFAETTKFDGEERRDLLPWELAQIAGRAGRFGLVERGHVGVLDGVPWAERRARASSRAALQPHVPLPSGHLGYRIVDEARIRPRLGDLGVDDPRDLDAALARLAPGRDARMGARELARGRVAVADPRPARRRAAPAHRARRRLSLEDTWKLVNAPVDEDNAELLATLALAVAGDPAQRSLLTFLLDADAPARRDPRGGRAGRARPQASCAGSRCSTRVSAASRSSGRRRWRRLPRARVVARGSGVSIVRSPTAVVPVRRSRGRPCAWPRLGELAGGRSSPHG